jgi:hypothetical protein
MERAFPIFVATTRHRAAMSLPANWSGSNKTVATKERKERFVKSVAQTVCCSVETIGN